MSVSTPAPSTAVSPLRQRMLEDMRMRQFAEHTQEGYIRAVRKLCTFLGNSLGIEARLLPAQYVRAYVRRNKTDGGVRSSLDSLQTPTDLPRSGRW